VSEKIQYEKNIARAVTYPAPVSRKNIASSRMVFNISSLTEYIGNDIAVASFSYSSQMPGAYNSRSRASAGVDDSISNEARGYLMGISSMRLGRSAIPVPLLLDRPTIPLKRVDRPKEASLAACRRSCSGHLFLIGATVA
jgi:hypothetical protein